MSSLINAEKWKKDVLSIKKRLKKKRRKKEKALKKKVSRVIINLLEKIKHKGDNLIMAFSLQKDYNIPEESSQRKKGIIQKITIQKKRNKVIIENLKAIGETDRAIAIENCGTCLEISDCKEQGERITAANFCRQRLCIVCASRRQAKFVAQMIPTLEYLAAHGYTEARYAHVVLTVKNVEGDKLKEAIKEMLKAYEKLRKAREWERSVLGAVRSLEVSYNSESGTYHPHLHVIILKQKYLPQKTLQSMWQKAASTEYKPGVYIRDIPAEEQGQAVAETLKYALKYGKVTEKPETLKTVFEALYGKRLISFSGEFAKARRALKLKDIETEEPLTDTLEGIKPNSQIIKYICCWDVSGGYYEIKREDET